MTYRIKPKLVKWVLFMSLVAILCLMPRCGTFPVNTNVTIRMGSQ